MQVSTQQIYLVSRTEEENHILRRKLEPLAQEFAPVEFLSAHPQGVAASIDERTVSVVLNYNEWSPRDAVVVEELRRAGYRGPVVLVAKTQIPEAIRELQSLENVVFVEKPFEPKDLLGIVRKFLSATDVYQRIHRRYPTMQDAEVEFNGRREGERRISRLFNLSKGGAYIEFSNTTPVKIGETLRLKLELKELNRTYTMPAKVVWLQKATPEGGTGVGVEFIGPGELQKMILGSFR